MSRASCSVQKLFSTLAANTLATARRAIKACPWGDPKKFVQVKRIEKVRLLLRDPEVSVEAAMVSVGVTDVPSLRRVFQRELGVSPAEYRRGLRAS
jgi:AraC-like DNA-binding protein